MDVTIAASSSRSSGLRGSTTVDERVIARIAGIAAGRVDGVRGLGADAAGPIGTFHNFLDRADRARGISIHVGDGSVSVEVVVVAGYPIALQPLAALVHEAVVAAVEDFVGLQVVEVTVRIADIWITRE